MDQPHPPQPDPAAAHLHSSAVTPHEEGFKPEETPDRNKDDEDVAFPAAPALETIEAHLATLTASSEALRRDFETKLKYDAQKQATIDRLHAELQRYKNAESAWAKQPLFRGLIQLYDDVRNVITHHEAEAASYNKEEALDLLRGFQQDVLDLLDNNNVRSFRVPEEQFDSKRQQALALHDTHNPELARCVHRHVRLGFQLDERIIRPEGVEVYKYRPSKSHQTPEPDVAPSATVPTVEPKPLASNSEPTSNLPPSPEAPSTAPTPLSSSLLD